jgi:site-specific DNA-methyltransferase (adenine-specific)
MNPIYENEWVKLYQGDCLEIMPNLDVKFDCCITDPPYGTTACKWDCVIPFEDMWKNLKRLMKSNGAICLFGSEPFSSLLRCSNLDMFKYDWIWNKITACGHLVAKIRPLQQTENISVFGKDRINYYPIMTKRDKIKKSFSIEHSRTEICGGKSIGEITKIDRDVLYPKNVISVTNGYKHDKFHPTQKPVALIEYLVKTYTNENDIVLDFTCGSGTTGIACMNTNRKCVLIEKEEKYCEITIKRLQEKEKEIAERLF